MDKFDNLILDILKFNARRSVSDIARDVNLSRSAVTARIKRLESDGQILGYHANLARDQQKPEMICAYLALKFDTSNSLQRCESHAQFIYQLDGVKSCRAISGETDMMLLLLLLLLLLCIGACGRACACMCVHVHALMLMHLSMGGTG